LRCFPPQSSQKIPLHICRVIKKPASISVVLREQEFVLHPLKMMFQKSNSTLICADLHIGKSGHFRKHGIAMPGMVNKNNFWNLMVAMDEFKPQRLLVLGDMVHSQENEEWNDFADFLDNYPTVKRVLVRGNHEICDDAVYRNMNFEVLPELVEGPFRFLHEADVNADQNKYQLAGHIHPAIRLTGHGRQSLRVPCFWFGKNVGILPAAGAFTGTHCITPSRGDRIFAIAENEVIEVL